MFRAAPSCFSSLSSSISPRDLESDAGARSGKSCLQLCSRRSSAFVLQSDNNGALWASCPSPGILGVLPRVPAKSLVWLRNPDDAQGATSSLCVWRAGCLEESSSLKLTFLSEGACVCVCGHSESCSRCGDFMGIHEVTLPCFFIGDGLQVRDRGPPSMSVRHPCSLHPACMRGEGIRSMFVT